jgi:hypothetical protein
MTISFPWNKNSDEAVRRILGSWTRKRNSQKIEAAFLAMVLLCLDGRIVEGAEATAFERKLPFSEHTLLAVVLPEGQAVFTVSSHTADALAKAKSLAETAAQGATHKVEAAVPRVFTYRTPEELFASAAPAATNTPGVRFLVAKMKCGRKVPRTEYGCTQVETNFAKTIIFEHYICQAGTNTCWTANTVIGVNNYYSSKEACETNGPLAKWEYVMGGRCD